MCFFHQAVRLDDGQISEEDEEEEDSLHLPLVPLSCPEVSSIVSESVSIYWDARRCGKEWRHVTAPSHLLVKECIGAMPGGKLEQMAEKSCRDFNQLVFDMTGEILCDIYRCENERPLEIWRRPALHRRQYHNAMTPPLTADYLLPIVQATVLDLLGLQDGNGRLRGSTANKWSVRKERDALNAVLVQELRQEEADWVNYDVDEVEVKMELTNHLFQFLLDDTVATLNCLHARRQHTSFQAA